MASVSVAGLFGCLAAAPASAQTTYYFSGFYNNWSDATQWSPNGVPGSTTASTDIAQIDDGGAALINDGDSFTPADVLIGNATAGQAGSGEVVQTGGTLSPTGTSPTIIIGDNGGLGEYDLSGGTINTNGGEFWVSQAAASSGTFNISGGTLNVNNWLAVGRAAANAVGIINMSGGLINQTGTNHITLGSVGGNGTINQTGGTISSATAFYDGETGPAVVNISDGLITAPTMELAVTAGGAVSGTLNMNGGTINCPTSFLIGNAGPGVWNMSGGGAVTASVQLGVLASGSGIVNLTGGTITTTSISAGVGTTTGNQLNFNGGLLQAGGNTTNWISVPSAEIFVQGGGANFDANGYAVTISQNLTGGGSVNMQGSAGSLTLGVSNGYTGGTNIYGGTLIPAVVTALGTNPNVYLYGGALGINDDGLIAGRTLNFIPNGSGIAGALQLLNYTSNLSFDTGAIPNLTLGAATGAASTLAGQITGGGSFTYVGPGVLNLTNTGNTYSGGTNVNAGVLQIVPGSIGTGSVNLNDTGTIGIGSDAAIAGLPLVFNGGGITFNNYASSLNFNQGVPITLGAAAGAASTLNGLISDGTGTTSVTFVGPGTLILPAANSYTGGTTIAGGTLNFASGAIGSGNVVLQGGATLQYAAGNTTDLTGGRTFTLGVGGGTIDLGTNNVTFTGNIIDPLTTGAPSGAFTKQGTGTLTLQGSMNTTDVFVRNGTLVLAGSAAVSTAYNPVTGNDDYSSVGQLTGDVGTLTVQDSATLVVAGDFNIGDVTGSTGTLNVSGNAVVSARTMWVGKSGTAVGTVNQTGGTVQQANNGAGAGDWRIGGNGTGDAAAVGIYNISGGTLTTGTNFQPGAYGHGTLTQTGGAVIIGTQTNGIGTGGGYLSIGRFPGGVGLYDMSTGDGTLDASATSVAIVGEQGTGTLEVGGTSVVNTNGLSIGHADGGTGTVIQTGGTINAPAGVTFGATATGTGAAVTGTYNLSGGTLNVSTVSRTNEANVNATFDFNGGTLAASLAGAVLMTGITTAKVSAGGAIIDTGANNVSISQMIQHDSTAPAIDGGLTKLGVGTLMLTSIVGDTYTGPTNISSGTIQLAPTTSASNLLPATATTISATGTLDLNGYSQGLGSLSGPAGASVLLGSTGGNTLTFSSTSGTATFNGVISGNGGLIKTGASTQVLGGDDTYTGITKVSGGTLDLGANTTNSLEVRNLGGIVLSSVSKLVVDNAASHADRTLIVVPSGTATYNISTASTILDLGSNDMDVTNAGSAGLTTITAQIKAGFKGGLWTGHGLISSAAAADPSHLTTLGVILNGTTYGTAAGSLGTFDTINPGANDVLVKYTYYGDANLDGTVDGSDYTKIDAGFNSHGTLTGWANGDFNYDGKIDGSDYTLIDNAFNTQGANLSTAGIVAGAAAEISGGGASSVPEPATLGLLTAGGLAMLARRRRRIG